MSAQSRVDPHTIAVYPPPSGPKNSACPEKLTDDTHGGAIDLDCFQFPEDRPGSGRLSFFGESTITAYTRAATADADRPLARNRLASILMKHSDDICTLEMGRLTAHEATVNATLSILTSIFSTASGIVQGETANGILAGLATTANASKGHIDAEVYRHAISTAVSHAIINERERSRAQIEISLTRPVKDYDVDHMIRDVNQYHQICSFYRGLELIGDAVDQTKVSDTDRQTALHEAIVAIDSRIQILSDRLKGKLSDEDTAATKKQITALRDQQTQLYLEYTTIKASSDAKSSNPSGG